jgi:hypothetical protein
MHGTFLSYIPAERADRLTGKNLLLLFSQRERGEKITPSY